IADDPAYSGEPLLHAESATALLRLSTVWRGRLEISRLSFDYPSVNLVRNEAGKWNLAALVERAEQIPSAPTARRISEERPRFPYIEADGGRLNLKLGLSKLPYALADADFAFWQESEQEWGIRLEARPVRTDADLHDTGTLKLRGTIERATEYEKTPVRLE